MATERQEENVARVRVGFEAFNRGDLDAVLAGFDEDIEIFSSPALANPGTFRGHDGYRRWVGQWLEAWDELELQVQRIDPLGDRHVAVDVRQVARGRGSGIPVEMEVTFMFEVGEERTKALHLYSSRQEAVTVAERREAESSVPD